MDNKLKDRLMKLHQDKLEVVLMNSEAKNSIHKSVYLTHQEIEDLCEFLNGFLYD